MEQAHHARVLERGDIYFFYRPRARRPSVEGIADIQRMYLVLHPRHQNHYREIIIGRKKLPELEGERFWALVSRTARRGEQMVPPEARPAGEGVYAIVRHEDHTHLAYELEPPEQPGEVQRALGIHPQGSYVVAAKNPRPGKRFVDAELISFRIFTSIAHSIRSSP